jgi:hypothetical protein
MRVISPPSFVVGTLLASGMYIYLASFAPVVVAVLVGPCLLCHSLTRIVNLSPFARLIKYSQDLSLF